MPGCQETDRHVEGRKEIRDRVWIMARHGRVCMSSSCAIPVESVRTGIGPALARRLAEPAGDQPAEYRPGEPRTPPRENIGWVMHTEIEPHHPDEERQQHRHGDDI